MRRLLGALCVLVALVGSSVTLTAAPAHASTVFGPRHCTGQPGQPPDIVSGDHVRKLSVCVKVAISTGDYFAAIDMHTYAKVGSKWVDSISDSITVNSNRLWIDSPPNTPVVVFTYGQDYGGATQCYRNEVGGPNGCSVPNVWRQIYVSTDFDIPEGDFDTYASGNYAKVSWRDDRGVPHGPVLLNILSPWT
jgi:hypothetical protein